MLPLRCISFLALVSCVASRGLRANTDDDGSSGTCVNIQIEDYGNIKLQLTDDATPVTVANFLSYIDEQWYDGLVFHRVIKNFMIQGGGYDSDLSKKKGTFPSIVNEAADGLSNTFGTIAMARTSDPNSATDEFYINEADNSYLDYSSKSAGYCAFGKVIEGAENVVAIASVKTESEHGMSDVPKTTVEITSVRRVAC